MAEQIRSIEAILSEMFKNKEGAICKYAKVRHTQYELDLWRKYNLPLREVKGSAKLYFAKRFLNGERIDQADEETLRKGFTALEHAVKDGCHGRCVRLTMELNKALEAKGLKPIKKIDKFLDWLTFAPEPKLGYDGSVIEEKPYGFPVLEFEDEVNRKEFWTEVKALLETGRILDMVDIERIVLWKRENAVSLK